jgi:hypothetical protein
LRAPEVRRITLLSALAPVDDEQPTERRVEPALDQIVDQRLDLSVASPTRPSLLRRRRCGGRRPVQVRCPICRPIDPEIGRWSLDKSDAIHRPAARSTAPRTGASPPISRCRPGHDRQVAFGKPDSPPEFAVDTLIFVRPTKAKSHTFRLRHEILSTRTAAYSLPTTFPICFA